MPRPLRILIAPDAFKECMTAREAAEAMERGVKKCEQPVETRLWPASDGGTGFVAGIIEALRGRTRTSAVLGPCSTPVIATWGTYEEERPGVTALSASRVVAVLEASAACGLSLVPPSLRDPAHTTTFGVGELIRAALDIGAGALTIGLGNTATCDGGCGMAAALGVRFFDSNRKSIDVPTGADLHRIHRIDTRGLDVRLRDLNVCAACDVNNPLFGPEGAALTFAPQKGATREGAESLDIGLQRLCATLERAGVRTFPRDRRVGAAGGLAFGMRSFANAYTVDGFGCFAGYTGLKPKTTDANLVLTGAGRLDATDLRGKAILGVSETAAERKVSTIALVGSTGPGADECLAPKRDGGLAAYHVITPAGMARDEALRRGPEFLEVAAERVVREWLHSRGAARA